MLVIGVGAILLGAVAVAVFPAGGFLLGLIGVVSLYTWYKN